MERLTYRDASGRWVLGCSQFHYPECGLPAHLRGNAVKILADYEDLGTVESLSKLVEEQAASGRDNT